MMIEFRKNFNCCKTIACKNFGVVDSEDYIHKSRRLGYLSIECKACGSNPPWINNQLVSKLLQEKLESQFGQKLTDCPKCSHYFFITEKTTTKLHGFTSAGTQRKKCTQCNTVFTVPHYKNSDALKAVLATIVAHQDMRESIKSSGLSARLYYFYLNKLALILSNFSRLNEQAIIKRHYLALYTQGKRFDLDHKRGIYTLITSEVKSGYILLQSNNLTQLALQDKDIYCSLDNTVIAMENVVNAENVLIDRYAQHLNRKHFEQLLVGELKPITNSHLIYPDKVAYIHFQLLKAFTLKTAQYAHYIEHESVLRSAALMASYSEIQNANADVYFFVPFAQTTDHLQGKEIGWWKDKWFTNEQGAYCQITSKQDKGDFRLYASEGVEHFYSYLNKHMNKGVNSRHVIDNLSEIHRVIFNYCDLINGHTRANVFIATDKIYTPASLLDEALKMTVVG
jgi:transposase-like protein